VLHKRKKSLPSVNSVYNNSMFFVDKFDDKWGNQPHKNTSVSVAICKQIFQFAVVNAWAHWKVQKKIPMKLRIFQEELVQGYQLDQFKLGFLVLQSSLSQKKTPKSKVFRTDLLYNTENHTLASSPDKKAKKCCVCSDSNSKTTSICSSSSTKRKKVYVHKECLAKHIDLSKQDHLVCKLITLNIFFFIHLLIC